MSDYNESYSNDDQTFDEPARVAEPAPATARFEVNDNDLRAIEAMGRLAALGHAELAADILAVLTGSKRCKTPAGDPGYRTSHHSTPKLDAAKARAQALIEAAKINRQNSHLRNRYADINAVLEASMSKCAEAGLAVTQTPWADQHGETVLTTRIACEGEWIEGDLPVRVERQNGINSKQAGGIALTYIRRYALNAMLGIPAGDDEDGDDGEEPVADEKPAAKNKWGIAVAAFAKVGVKPPVMLAFLGRATANEVDDDDHRKLEQLYQGLKAGEDKARAAVDKVAQRLAESAQ